MLVHHADAGVHRVTGALELLHDVVQEDLALVSPVQAVEHVHEGGLAGTVLTEETVDLAGFDGQVDVVIRRERAKALGDATKLELHDLGLPAPPGSRHCFRDSLYWGHTAGF